MSVTTSVNITEIVQSEIISSQLIATAYENVVAARYATYIDGPGSPTASFPSMELDSVEVLTTEGTTSFSVTDLNSTEIAAVTAGVTGIYREISEFALETNMLGADGLENWVVNDGGILCATNLDNDLCALFGSFSALAGTSGVDLSVATIIQAIGNVDASNAKGKKVAVLDNQQLNDLRTDVATTGAALFTQPGVQSLMNNLGNVEGVAGEIFGVEIAWTNQTDTANTNADVCGWMGIDGSQSPTYASLAVRQVWAPRSKSLPNLRPATQGISVTHSFGVGRVSAFASKIVTDA
jgi:hypothetical protein